MKYFNQCNAIQPSFQFSLNFVYEDSIPDDVSRTVKEGVSLLNYFDLSYSERKFINIASALLRNTQIIVFDEITGTQDLLGKKRIVNILNWLKEKGTTVLFISHILISLLKNFSDVMIMSNGSIQYFGDIEHAFLDDKILTVSHISKPIVTTVAENLEISNIVCYADLMKEIKKKLNTD
ncbi:MAG: ABC transporter ATP-binding protein [Absicoccus sp.]|nr:ABC transporter ATP-binding protein [Absicoccus sp.]